MDESTCLLRSFSNPSDVSLEVKEGNPIRALTESISFGRFMSESLAWEKWSTFSHNRYMEEVEQFSKPGSVAQKKAFFEAHYKKRAAMRANALLEQTNIVTNDAACQTVITNAASVEPLLDADLTNSNGSPDANQHGKDVSYAEIANTAGVDGSDAEQGLALMEEDLNMEECHQVENSKALESGDIHGKIMTTPNSPPPPVECADSKNSTSSSKKRRTSYSSKSSVPSKTSKLPLHPSKRVVSAQARSDANVAKPTRNSIDKKKMILNSLPMSTNFAGKTNKTLLRKSPPQTPTRTLKKAAGQENLAPSSEKRQSNSASKSPNHGRVSKQATSRTGNNHALINKKPTLDPNKQRRTAQKSLHMSMNFSPRPSETNKTSPKISRESSTALQTLTRASVNGGSKHASKVLQSRDKRTISVVNKSVSTTGDGKWPSHSNSWSKSSNASGTSTRSSISFCPFTFRSEERAAKRKEFFKKLEDDTDSKKAEKSQIQIKSKEKAKNDNMTKLKQSTDVKARSNQDSCHGSQFAHNLVKKIGSTWPQSTKLGRNPSPPSPVQDANSRPPRRPSINTESGSVKNNRIPCSGTSLPKKRHENSPPNIQHTFAKRSISYKHEHRGSFASGCNR